MQPMGYLGLQSGSPVYTADQISKGCIYYMPDKGNTVPIYDGSVMQDRVFTSSDTDKVGLTLNFDGNSSNSGYHAAYNAFDVFVFWNGSACVLGTGPARSSLYALPSGSGTSEVQMFKGIKTNKYSVAIKWGTSSGNITNVPANEATHSGGIFMTGLAQTGMSLRPAPSSPAPQNILGVSNTYNKKLLRPICRDSATQWTYSSGSVREANNSDGNRIWWFDALGDTNVISHGHMTISPVSTSASAYTFGVTYNQSTNLGLGVINQGAFVGSTSQGTTMPAFDTFFANPGLNWVQLCEQSTTAGMNIYANGFTCLRAELEA